MLRAAIIADSHFDASPGGRFEECCRVHDWIADDIARRGVDLVKHSGDIYERKSTPEERNAVAAWVRKITQYAPLVIVRGNHDAHGDLAILSKLETEHEVIVEESAGVHCVGGFVVGCMAWPTKANILALDRISHAEGERIAQDALRNVLRGLGDQMAAVRFARGMEGAPKVLLTHAMARGSKTAPGQPLTGCDFELGLEDFALARADFVALGHIHTAQEWPPNVVYPGSPRRTDYGDTHSKGYVIAEFDGGQVRWERVPTPCAQMLLLEDEWGVAEDGAQTWLVGIHNERTAAEYRGAEVRFRYYVPADMRESAKVAATRVVERLMAQGAVHVKPEEIVKTTGSARAPEVALAKTIGEKLAAYWSAKKTQPEPSRAERLIGKANDLEARHAL